jgi:hypothetical protein
MAPFDLQVVRGFFFEKAPQWGRLPDNAIRLAFWLALVFARQSFPRRESAGRFCAPTS